MQQSLPDFFPLGLLLLQPFEFFLLLCPLFPPFVDVFAELLIQLPLLGLLASLEEISISPEQTAEGSLALTHIRHMRPHKYHSLGLQGRTVHIRMMLFLFKVAEPPPFGYTIIYSWLEIHWMFFENPLLGVLTT